MGEIDVQAIYNKLEELRTQNNELDKSLTETTFHVKDLGGRMRKVEESIDTIEAWKREEQVTRQLITKVLGFPLYVVTIMQMVLMYKSFFLDK